MQKKKILAALLSAAMVITSAAIPVLADEDAPIDIGAYEEDIELAADVVMPTDSWSTVAGEAEPETDYVVDEATGNVEIKTALGLAWLAQQSATNNYSGKTVTLTAPVDLSAHLWEPIGSDSKPFAGTFTCGDEENVNTISGLRINDTTAFQGLFGQVNGTLRNIKIDDAVVVGNNHSAILAGRTTATVDNCDISNATLTAGSSGYNGILTGEAYTGTVQNCDLNTVTMTTRGAYTGGFSGQGYARFNDCTLTGATLSSTNWKIGGIVGQYNEGAKAMSNITVSESKISGSDEVGGLVGFANYSNNTTGHTFTNCHVSNVTFTPGSAYSTTTLTCVGGLVGSFSATGSGGMIGFTNCSVKGCEYNGATQSSVGSLIGESYWRTVAAANKKFTFDGVKIEDNKFICKNATDIGSICGDPFYSTGDYSTNYNISSVTVKNVKINPDDDPDAKLYIMGTSYPQGTTSFNPERSNVEFGGGNSIESDLTPFEPEDQKVVQDPETGDDIVMNWKGEELKSPDEMKVVPDEATKTEIKDAESELMEQYRQEIASGDESMEDLPKGDELYFHVVTELEVETSDPADGVYTVTVNPTYKILASTEEDFEDKDGQTVKSGEFEISNPVDVTLMLPGGFAEEGNYINIKHTHNAGETEKTYYYTSKVGAGNSVTFKSEHGFSKFEFTVAAGPELKDLGIAEDEGFTYDPEQKEYAATVSGTTETATITATAADGYTISIEDKAVNSGDATSIALKPGRNVITVTVSEGDASTTYTITITRETSENVKVIFKGEGNKYDIYIAAADDDIINRLSTADLTFVNKPDTKPDSDETYDIAYTITGTDDVSVINAGNDRYEFNFNGVTHPDSGAVNEVKIGEVTFTGVGTGKFGVKTFAAEETDTNIVHAAAGDDNIVTDFTAAGDGDTTGKLTISDIDAEELDSEGVIKYDLNLETKEVPIKVMFPNEVLNKSAAYTDMTVEVSSLLGSETFNLGGEGTTYAEAGTDDVKYAQYTMDATMAVDTRYTLTFTGAGYRTYSVDVVIPKDAEEPTVTVWNNVMDENTTVVSYKKGEDTVTDGKGVKYTFLAGDIVGDNTINLYDLSAVVAYFGRDNKTDAGEDLSSASNYAQYDLNRDGRIDSKDIAMVLVSWGN